MDMSEYLINTNPQSICESFVLVADHVFVDKRCNWGRIVTLYAFGACLVISCANRSIVPDLSSEIGETMGAYMADNVAEWIYVQGGWIPESLYI